MKVIKTNKAMQMTTIINNCVKAAKEHGINSLHFNVSLMAAQNAYSNNPDDCCNFSCKLGFALESAGISVSEYQNKL